MATRAFITHPNSYALLSMQFESYLTGNGSKTRRSSLTEVAVSQGCSTYVTGDTPTMHLLLEGQ